MDLFCFKFYLIFLFVCIFQNVSRHVLNSKSMVFPCCQCLRLERLQIPMQRLQSRFHRQEETQSRGEEGTDRKVFYVHIEDRSKTYAFQA